MVPDMVYVYVLPPTQRGNAECRRLAGWEVDKGDGLGLWSD